jgi:hypothetical protein
MHTYVWEPTHKSVPCNPLPVADVLKLKQESRFASAKCLLKLTQGARSSLYFINHVRNCTHFTKLACLLSHSQEAVIGCSLEPGQCSPHVPITFKVQFNINFKISVNIIQSNQIHILAITSIKLCRGRKFGKWKQLTYIYINIFYWKEFSGIHIGSLWPC